MQRNIVDTNWINQIFAPLKDPKLLEKMFGYSTKEPWFFTEFTFLAVFGIFLVIYAALVQKNAWRKIYIISFSLFFYYKSSGPFLGLFVLMIVSDYLFALAIEKQQGIKKKILLWLLNQEIQDSLVFKNFIEGTKVPHEGIVIKEISGDRKKVAKVINPDYLIYGEKNDVGDSH